jgi:hypothetical protein
MELHGIDEITPMTDEAWERVIAWHRKRMGRGIEPVIIPMTEVEFVALIEQAKQPMEEAHDE